MIGALRSAARPVLMVAGLLAAGLLLRRFGLHDRLPAAGEAGVLVFLLFSVAACAVGIPRQVVAYAGGLGFGFWSGSLLALVAMVLACALDFGWARLLARDWVAARLGQRLARLDQALARNPFVTALTMRLMPVGNNLLFNLLAGISGVSAAPFLLGSALGYIPQTVIFGLLGAGVRINQGTQLALAGTLFAASTLLGWWLYRRHRAAQGQAPGVSSRRW